MHTIGLMAATGEIEGLRAESGQKESCSRVAPFDFSIALLVNPFVGTK